MLQSPFANHCNGAEGVVTGSLLIICRFWPAIVGASALIGSSVEAQAEPETVENRPDNSKVSLHACCMLLILKDDGFQIVLEPFPSLTNASALPCM